MILYIYVLGFILVFLWASYDMLKCREFELHVAFLCGLVWFITIPIGVYIEYFQDGKFSNKIQEWYDKRNGKE